MGRDFSLTLDRESGILETSRGVAPGVCVLLPGLSWLMPLAGVGWNRPPAARCAEVGADRAQPEPFVGQPRQFSPEQDCLDVGRNRARVHFAWAHRNLCEVLCRRLDLSNCLAGQVLD
jgi:hypothetical protein